MKNNIALACLLTFNCSQLYGAEVADVILHFERQALNKSEIYCDPKNKITLNKNDFEILEYALMSSNQGHRHAVITIKNASNGQRFLRNEDLAAVLANCKYTSPINLEIKFSAGEIITTDVNFGLHRYPIVNVVSN